MDFKEEQVKLLAAYMGLLETAIDAVSKASPFECSVTIIVQPTEVPNAAPVIVSDETDMNIVKGYVDRSLSHPGVRHFQDIEDMEKQLITGNH